MRYYKRDVDFSGKVAGIKVDYDCNNKPVLNTEEKIGFNIKCATNRGAVNLLSIFYNAKFILADKKKNLTEMVESEKEDLKMAWDQVGFSEYKVFGPPSEKDQDIKAIMKKIYDEAMK